MFTILMNTYIEEVMNKDGCHGVMEKAVWLSFRILSTLGFGSEIVLICIHLGDFI